MSRYIQAPAPKEPKAKGKEKPRELPKAGSYGVEQLIDSKKIPTQGGFQ